MWGLSKWISKSYREIQTYMNREFKEEGINITDYVYLIHIIQGEGTNQEEIAMHLSITKTASSKIVKKLMEKELITRNRSLEDKRAFELYISQKGRELKERLDVKVEKWEREVLGQYSKEEIREFIDKLEKTYENTKDINDKK